MKTPEEATEDFFDGPGRKQDLANIIKAARREGWEAGVRAMLDKVASGGWIADAADQLIARGPK